MFKVSFVAQYNLKALFGLIRMDTNNATAYKVQCSSRIMQIYELQRRNNAAAVPWRGNARFIFEVVPTDAE